MKVHGCDCSIVIKTAYREFDVPYSEETVREAVSLMQEEAAIEGDGVCKVIKKTSSVTGCIVTPLTLNTAPHLLYLVMGAAGKLEFISETRNLYKYQLSLLPMEDTEHFDLIQDRGGELVPTERRLFEGCRVKGFELRIMREEIIKLKLDICGKRHPVVYPYTDTYTREDGERFNGDNVTYKINGKDYKNIYGLTLLVKKDGGTITELWIKRILDKAGYPAQSYDLPEIIDEIVITAQLLRDKYELKHYGTFRITVKELVLASDETQINSVDTVIGPLRYYVAGTVSTEVFESGDSA
jgi:hypothetical protein